MALTQSLLSECLGASAIPETIGGTGLADPAPEEFLEYYSFDSGETRKL